LLRFDNSDDFTGGNNPAAIDSQDTSWTVAATGDFNADNQDDGWGDLFLWGDVGITRFLAAEGLPIDFVLDLFFTIAGDRSFLMNSAIANSMQPPINN